jgi:indolepyruvate ferredoxin oxidoreductase beta subunit
MFPRHVAEAAGKTPVFTPYPIPGDVDLVIAGEMAESGRAIEKGFVTPNITTLIASSHRVYSMPEKEALGDGIVDLAKVADVAARAARQFVCFDMQKAADETGSVVSSVMLGAIAASGALPFERQAFEDTIRNTGKAVESNLRGFAAGFNGIGNAPAASERESAQKTVLPDADSRALAARIRSELPAAVGEIGLHGTLRVLDYQDSRYADDYIDRLITFAKLDKADADFSLTKEVARQLALQMSYEDTIRVADLKTRSARIGRIREQVAVTDEQPLRVVEYFHPRIEEVCDTLPAFLGSAILRSTFLRRLLAPFFRKGRNIATTSMSGYLFLHFVAKMKRFRRGTYRFHQQQILIDDWLERVSSAALHDYDYALSIARCIEIVKGYGDTYERGLSRYRATIGATDQSRSADAVRRLHRAALADEKGNVFRETLASMEANG